jgi:hypothetical protein
VLDSYKATGLWKRSLGIEADTATDDALSVLKGTYKTFRDNASALTSNIAKSLPNLTVHDITHLDSLWETADLIAGEAYPLNPAEGFVLGGAILLHDAALCFEAYRGGQAGLRETTEWKDAFSAIKARAAGDGYNASQDEADFAAMRLLHASQAGSLALQGWDTPEGETIYLIDKFELRKHYGKLIGDIASSHHWPIEDVASRLQTQINAPAGFPRGWRVDPIKIACLLRCADAAHIDSKRAPDFLRALANLHGISAHHWTAQNWLERADYDTADPERNAIIYTAGKPFDERNAEAWWVAYDAIQLVDRELRSAATLLERRPQCDISPPFRVRRVTGASSPAVASQTIKTIGWNPQAVEIHVSNLERLISKLGGEKLYGEEQSILIALRELIQNARDSIIARYVVDPHFNGSIRISHKTDGKNYSIIVEDNGIGMSERVITGPLLDFGSSFWASDLARTEFPGLLSGGYQPIGKFGIGFYSVFMVASGVSIASRRFDAGHDAVTQVKFPNGLSLRPIIVAGAPLEFGYSISTRVELRLKTEIGDPSSILLHKGRQGYEGDQVLPLDRCLSILCAGLDVTVELMDNSESFVVVHRPLSELDTLDKRIDWLAGIMAPQKRNSKDRELEAIAKRLRPVMKDGKTMGLSALSIAQPSAQHGFGTVMTVGGLAANISPGDLSRFIGAMDFEPNSARRDPTSQVSAGSSALAVWAAEQKLLLPDRDTNPIAWCVATTSLADLQIDPIEVATFLVNLRDKLLVINLDSAIDMICAEGLAFYQSPSMRHTEMHHGLGSFNGMPTFWPIVNSSFISLERDEEGKPPITSILSCLERHAAMRKVNIVSQYSAHTANGYFGKMPILLLREYAGSS